MIAPRFCPYCGAARIEGARFCGGCGADIASQPAGAPPTMPPVRRGIGRKAVVLGITAALLVGIVGVYAAASRGGSSPSPVLAYAPADTVLYAEARLDLPGDQKINLVALLAHFPILDGASGGTGGLDKLLDDLIGGPFGGSSATPAPTARLGTPDPYETPRPQPTPMRRPDYSNDIRPWFGGTVAVSYMPSATGNRSADAVALVSVTNPAKALAWWRARPAYGEVPTHDTYGGVDLLVLPWDTVAGVIDGNVLLVGTVAGVHAAIDARKNGGLAANPSFAKARNALSGEGIGSAFLDVRALARWLPSILANEGSGYSPIGLLNAFLGRAPDWITVRLRAESGALVLASANQPATGGVKRANGPDMFAGNLPANTVAVFDVHDLGTFAQGAVDILRANSDGSRAINSLDDALGTFGGLQSLLDQTGTMDFVSTWDGSRTTAGLVGESRDPAATGQLIGTLASQAAASGYGVTTEMHAGTEITIIDPYASSSSVPLVGRITVQLALKGSLVVAGLGDGFAASVLDAPANGSLAGQTRYTSLMARVGASNTLGCYFDITALREMAELQASTNYGGLDRTYQRDVRKWLVPFDTLGCAMVTGDQVDHTTLILTVK